MVKQVNLYTNKHVSRAVIQGPRYRGIDVLTVGVVTSTEAIAKDIEFDRLTPLASISIGQCDEIVGDC